MTNRDRDSLPMGLNRISWKLEKPSTSNRAGTVAALPMGLNRISYSNKKTAL